MPRPKKALAHSPEAAQPLRDGRHFTLTTDEAHAFEIQQADARTLQAQAQVIKSMEVQHALLSRQLETSHQELQLRHRAFLGGLAKRLQVDPERLTKAKINARAREGSLQDVDEKSS
jgi:hypothetical protein